MAKANNTTLTVEELLEQVLVKENEQPYEVPVNWVVCKCSVFSFEKGKKPLILFNDAKTNSSPYVNIKYFETGIADEYTTAVGTNKFCIEDDILIVWDGARSGLVGTNVRGALGSTLSKIKYYSFNKKYVYRYFESNYEDINRNSRGTGIPHVDPTYLRKLPFPIPPLAEQQRIVDTIESLFSKLDHAKELVQNALDTFKNRKSAILHQAFTGELTKKWREENGVVLDSWERKPLNVVSVFRAGYAFDSKCFTNNGYQVVRIGNLYNGILDLKRNPVFIPKETDNASLVAKNKINVGDILLALTGTKYKRDYGNAVLIEDENNILLNQRIVSLTAKTVETKCLLYYLRTSLFRDVFFSNETGGVNQGNVSSKFVENIMMPIPSIPEQKEIVRILDELLEKEQKSKELCDVIDKIDLMKKAILARAFRSELGTNNPNDESAIELLKKVLQDKM